MHVNIRRQNALKSRSPFARSIFATEDKEMGRQGDKTNHRNREGSVLIVVIGLLLLLMLIGLTFFTFANQEHSAAEYYAESYKIYQDSPNGDSLFEFGLEQLIIGPRDDNQQSVLWPGRYSLVPNMLGMFAGNPNDNAANRAYLQTVPTDRHPFNGGTGMNLVSGLFQSGANAGKPNGSPVVDQNFDGIDDNFNSSVNNYLLLNLNLSGAAQLSGNALALPNLLGAGTNTRQGIYNNFPATDVGYTYPDINNMFLAHIGVEPTNGNLVVIPSFFRPALMRDSNGVPLQKWYLDQTGNGNSDLDSITNNPIDTTTRSLHAHPGHVALQWDSTPAIRANVSSGISRYLSQAVIAGATNPYTNQPNPRTIQYFGYPSVDSLGNPAPFTGNAKDSFNNPINGQMGLFTNTTLPNNLDYPVDNDNDGIRDSHWLDLGYPATTLTDGRKMIPLFSFLVLDTDSLINLNTSGNASWLKTLSRPLYGYAPGASSASTNTSISHSNLGTSRSEINPFWALIANPRSTTYLTAPNVAANGPNSVFQAYRGVFGLSNLNSSTTNGYDFDRIEAANMDMLFLLWGRPNFNVTLNNSGKEIFAVNNVIPGLWGDVSYLLNGLSNGVFGTSPAPNNSLSLFPQPGMPGYDDNGNLLAGLTDAAYNFNGNVIGGDPALYQLPLPLQSPLGTTNLLFPQYATAAPLTSSVTILPFSQPLDFTGGGQWTTGGAYGQIAALYQPNTSYPATYLRYNGYQGSYYTTVPTLPSVPVYIPYQEAFPTSGTFPASQYGSLSANPITTGVIDEADERVSDPLFATINDQTVPVDETAALQVDQQDYQSAIGQSRLRQLMSFNFEQNLQAQHIRRHFTTASADRNQHAFAAAIAPNSTSANAGGNYNYNNPTKSRFWEYASGNWDGTSANGTPAGPYLQFPPMVLTTSITNSTGMDGLVPAETDIPGTTNTLNVKSAEPFRMELAALIGAKLNDPVTFVNANGRFTPAPYQYRSSQAAATPWQQQLRLNINRFLTAANPSTAFGSSVQQYQQNPLRYRDLTPHPTSSQWTSNGYNAAAINVPVIDTTTTKPRSFVTDSGSFSTRPDLQEFWARRDRQQMARDIYVMLYMFGGGFESEDLNANGTLDTGEDLNGNGTLDHYVNVAALANQPKTQANPIRAIYEDWQLYEMAQFAVNMVDTLDRDNVISVFEFDMDLQDGWNLDDDPYGQETVAKFPNVLPAETWKTGDRGVVFGVEAQQLAFNEALVVVAPYVRKDPNGTVPDNAATDHPASAWDDSKRDRTFTYLELFNVAPYDLPLGNIDGTPGNGKWQVMVLNPAMQGSAPQNPPTSNAWSLLTLTNGTAAAGRPYSIGSYSYDAADTASSGFTTPVSRFVIDPNWNSSVTTIPDPAFAAPTQSQIVPGYNTVTSAFPSLDLDLVFSYGVGTAFKLTDSGYNPITTQGGFLDLTTATAGAAPGPLATAAGGPFAPNYQTTFILRRRLNLDRPAPTITAGNTAGSDELDNPWIEVDRITYWNQIAPTDVAASAPPSNPPGAFFNLRSPQDSQLGGANNAAALDIRPKLSRLQSRERRQPLDGFEGATAGGGNNPPSVAPLPSTVPVAPTASATLVLAGSSRVNFDGNGVNLGGSGVANAQFNTVGQTNYYTSASLSGVFTLWQPHFDRDFASVMELLSVPLYGPSNVTQNLAAHAVPALNTLTTETPLPATVGNMYMPVVAQAKFLRPQHPVNIVTSPTVPPYPKFDNRWYRVLELLEVPSRENQQVETTLLTQYPWLFPKALQRTQGKMNPNTFRYGENLFALLDDPTTFDVTTYTPFGYNSMDGYYKDAYSVNDGLEGGSRNWWGQLLMARDQKDATTGLYLPGTPSSRPFRSFSHFESAPAADVVYNRSSTDDTMLRTLPLDTTGNVPGLDKRGLFEARTMSDLASKSQPANNSIDYYTRQRVLSKISGNTTPRSNTFLVWMTVGFFEAYEAIPASTDTSGNIVKTPVLQIGAEMTDQTRHRGFFVVDRSLLEDAWVPPTAPNYNNGYYDYSKFVRYRKTIQ